MNIRFLPIILALLPLSEAVGKPPPPARVAARPSPTPATVDDSGPSLLRWLLLQNGSATAAAVPWPEIVRAVSGRQVASFDPAAPADAATLAKLGAALDAILPHLNKPDGILRATPALTSAEIAARIADELRTTLDKAEPAGASADALCPVLRWTENSGGRTCYLVVALYPTGVKDAAVHALSVRAADLAAQITSDGACLLVGIEHNGKTGRELALLNWEAIDLSRLSLRCAVTFETDANGLHVPGATLGDGRRGRD